MAHFSTIMKKGYQTNVRKVYGANVQPVQQQQQQQHQHDSQINAVRKIHNLLSSGAVTVTGPSQSKILKQKVSGTVATDTVQNKHVVSNCYVCNDQAGNQPALLAEAVTATSNTKLPNKIGQILGQGYMVIVNVDDLICKRCLAMINHFDRLEADSERVKKNVLNYLMKKYNLSDDDGQVARVSLSPPVKMQKLNSGGTVNRKTVVEDNQDNNAGRKITVHSVQAARDPQFLSVFDSGEHKQVTVTQTKILTQQQNVQQQQQIRKQSVKVYKCLSCDFKTTDYKQFQPHYETCKQQTQQNEYHCKICKKNFTNNQSLKQHISEKHTTDHPCNLCNIKFLNEITLKKHIELNHPEIKIVETNLTNASSTTPTILYSCSVCQYKATDKQNYDEHLKKHLKVKPFKCRLCSIRFETREQASIHAKAHQPNYFKCGTCSASFALREQLVKHFETHQPQHKVYIHHQQQQPHQQQQQQQQIVTTQKLLQDTIDEALREPSEGIDTKGIHFFSCNVCSLTFIQENYYNQHMETHNRDNKKISAPAGSNIQNIICQEPKNNSNNLGTTAQSSNTVSETDIESIFEKMHSDKTEPEIQENERNNDNLVITSQENSGGGITFNITIPQKDAVEQKSDDQQPSVSTSSETIPVGIDMPVLDEPAQSKTEQTATVSDSEQQNQTVSVSMPSLDDDVDSQSQPSNTDQAPMDLEEIQNSVEGGQIKFILNENGQILQLDNHIITDAEGNQILVQGTDSEQLQQLLQSVGVLHTGDSLDGETLQMIGENNQMIIVQQGDNEAQLIDASLLNADGHIVIQQSRDDELQESSHVPVSVAFTTHEQNIHINTNSAEHQQEEEQEQEQDMKNEHQSVKEDDHDKKSDNSENQNGLASERNVVSTTQALQTTSTNETTFFALEDLMQHPEQKPSN